MNVRIWSRQVVAGMLSLMALLGLPVCVEAVEESHPPVRVQSQPRSRLTEITAMEVVCEDLETLELQVEGKTASGEVTTESQVLPPEEYQVESKPFDRYAHDDEGDYSSTCHRILYRKGSRTYVAGTVENTRDREGDPAGATVELRNVSWGFDLKKQGFWVHPRPERMMPLPRMFRRRDWRGVRFLIPVPLKRYWPKEVRPLIEGRGGVLVALHGPVDVVLLPDTFTFTRSRPRNAEAEEWIRKGASVLLEGNFPNEHKEQPVD